MRFTCGLQWSLMVLTPLVLSACTGGSANEPVALETDEKVLFSCSLEAGAPHKRINVLEITMTPDEIASAKEAEQDADEEPPTDPDTTTLEKSVRLSVYEMENGAEGHCFRRNDGGRYYCQSFDGGLKLEWKSETAKDKVPGGPADVTVREKWIFGTKVYGANCTHKA